MTRQQVIDAVNRHRHTRGSTPVHGFSRALAYARQHQLISEEHLEWARLGYLPTPQEREARRAG